MNEPVIHAEHLTKCYGPIRAVDDISFDVAAGEVLGFLGPNGAGKTTTMRILTCYMGADSGKVTIDGRDITDDHMAAKAKIGYLPENNPLYEDLAVVEYLKFVGEVRGMAPGLCRERLEQCLQLYGLADVVSRNIGELSKGYKQRVGLAQAALHDPPIMILDEPTSGLDPNQIIEIRNLIREIGRTKTVILSTHNLSEVEATCSRILIINEGRIVAHDTPEALESKGHGTTVYISLKEDGTAREDLARLDGVADVSPYEGEGGIPGFALACEPGTDPRERIFDLAVAKGWKLLELRSEGARLEDIFTKLTKG